jgi:hypothetical protein
MAALPTYRECAIKLMRYDQESKAAALRATIARDPDDWRVPLLGIEQNLRELELNIQGTVEDDDGDNDDGDDDAYTIPPETPEEIDRDQIEAGRSMSEYPEDELQELSGEDT